MPVMCHTCRKSFETPFHLQLHMQMPQNAECAANHLQQPIPDSERRACSLFKGRKATMKLIAQELSIPRGQVRQILEKHGLLAPLKVASALKD